MNQKQSMYLPPKNILSDGSPQIAEVNNLQLICDKDAGLGEKVIIYLGYLLKICQNIGGGGGYVCTVFLALYLFKNNFRVDFFHLLIRSR